MEKAARAATPTPSRGPEATSANSTDAATGFVRGLGLLDSTMIVAGSMIGSGIFIVSADIARQVGSAGWLLLVWRIGILSWNSTPGNGYCVNQSAV
jgi:hypothetical protein